jgi:hypothetical protein
MTSGPAHDGDEFLWKGGSDCKDNDAKEDVRDTELVCNIGSGLGEDVASETDGEEAKKEIENMVSKMMSFAAMSTRWRCRS